MQEVTVGGAKSKVQIIAFVPSIDTDTCALETVYFNKRVAKRLFCYIKNVINYSLLISTFKPLVFFESEKSACAFIMESTHSFLKIHEV
jgi:hypothetical protein